MWSRLLREESDPKSEQVQDIIERMPENFGRLVMYFFSGLVLVLVLFGVFIKYPDVIRGESTLNASAGPVKLISNASGKLTIVASLKPKSHVKSGTLIGYIENPAKLQDVHTVDSVLRHLNLNKINERPSLKYFPEQLSLGELNEKYFSFIQAFYNYANHFSLNLYEQQEAILNKQVVSQQSRIKSTNQNTYLLRNAYSLLEKSYRRDSTLHSKNVLSIADLEKTRMDLLAAQRSFESLKAETSDGEFQLEDVLNKLQQIAIQKIETKVQAEIRLTSSYFELTESIKQWQLKYTLVSPIDGTLEFSNFWKTNDYINAGQELFSILPNNRDVFAQVLLPEAGAGKVKLGQKVVLKLNDFPYNEYGSIQGRVKDRSLITNQKINNNNQKESQYLVIVEMPNGLLTNYGTRLDFKFGAKGTAEIITSDRRLFQRLFENLKYQANK